MICKLLTIGGAVIAMSVAGFAADNGNSKCSAGKKCGGKVVGPTVNGERPLTMEPKDTCKGTVKCVNQARYPNGNKTEMTVQTPNGDRKVMMQGNGAVPVQSGDQVEVTGRNVEVNGDKVMMGEQVNRTGTSNLNSSVQFQNTQKSPANTRPVNNNPGKTLNNY